eukprot:2665180-Alexandrium_andersonii.AAC.1
MGSACCGPPARGNGGARTIPPLPLLFRGRRMVEKPVMCLKRAEAVGNGEMRGKFYHTAFGCLSAAG